MKIALDTDKLTIGDLEDFEAHAGLTLSEAVAPRPVIDPSTGVSVKDDKGRPVAEVQLAAKTLKTLVWIVARKDNPGFTLDDARNVNVTELEFAGSEDDPQDAEGKESV